MVYSLLCSLIFIFGHKLGIFLYLYGVDRTFVSTVWRSVVAVAPETPQNTAWSSFDFPATTSFKADASKVVRVALHVLAE